MITIMNANRHLVPQMDNDPLHVSWASKRALHEYLQMRNAVERYGETGYSYYLEDAQLWLDALFSRMNTFSLNGRLILPEIEDATKGFHDRMAEPLKAADRALGNRELSPGAVAQRMAQILKSIETAISSFQIEMQKGLDVVIDERRQKAGNLLRNQQTLLLFMATSFAILFALFWLRSKQALWLASHDDLTGLLRRSSALSNLSERGNGGQTAVFCLSADRFDTFRTTLGYQASDQIIVRIAERLKSAAGRLGQVARCTEDQFILWACGPRALEWSAETSARLNELLAEDFNVAGRKAHLSFSTGLVFDDGSQGEIRPIVEQAELAMLAARRRGGGAQIVFDQTFEEEAARRRFLENELRTALDEDQLVLFFQPKIDLKSKEVRGAEALLRWIHPDDGMIPPDHFIGIAEDTRMIIPIGEWVIDRACRSAAKWRKMAGDDFHIAVNVSPVQFESEALATAIGRSLSEHHADPSMIELEITESIMMEDERRIDDLISCIRSMGVGFALDDFGKGYSGLSYLDRRHFQKVKIDRGFIQSLDRGLRRSPIVEAVLHIGQAFDFQVCAEGIEDQEMAELLSELGCQEGQGYYFGKPMPEAEFLQWLHERRPNQTVPASSPQPLDLSACT